MISKILSFKTLSISLLCLTSIFLVTTQVAAQSQASTGQIAGVVRDSAEAAIPNATVRISNTSTGLTQTTTTNEEGLFRFVLLPPGTYKVSAEATGFSKVEMNNVVVAVGQTADANLTIGVGSVQENITVTSEAVQTTQSQPDALVNETAITNLPINGRRFQDFVTLTPTAQVEPVRNGISLSGQRGINSNVSIDGADYNQPFFGGIRGGERSNNAYTIPQEAIREFQVVASGYSAEFGRSTGGIVNVVTKSGTNDFHGSAFYLHRPKELARGNPFFDSLETRLNRKVDPAQTQQQWGGSLGGPVKKDKAFFFFSYEQQRVRNPRAVVFDRLTEITAPASLPAEQKVIYDFYKSLETPFEQTNDAQVYLGRFDYNFSDAHRFNVRYSRSMNEGKQAVATGDALDPTTNRALSSNGTEKDDSHTVVGQLTDFFKSNLVNELRVQYSRENRPRLANVEAPGADIGGFGSFGTRSFFPTTQSDWRFQVSENLTWIVGNHTIKFGVETNHVFADQIFGFNQFGVFAVSSSTPATVLRELSTTTGKNRFDSSLSSYQKQIGNLQLAFASDEVAYFAQDAWRIRPNFTLNYGLRWEGQFNPSPEANNDSLINKVRGFTFPSGYKFDPTRIPDSTKQFGPRLGFAWDPFKSGKTVVRGFSGIYYAKTPLILLTAAANNFRIPAGDLSLQLPFSTSALASTDPRKNCTTVYCQLKLIGVDLNTYAIDKLPNLTAAQVQSVAAALGLSVDPFFGAQPISMANDFRNPKSYQFGGGIEREVGGGLTIGIDYSQIKTVYLQLNRDLNLPLPRIRTDDPAQRPFYGLRSGTARPISSLGSVTLRESTGNSLYRAMTVRTNLKRKWGQVNAYYTLSKNLSTDDNERNATGFQYENFFNFGPEYSYSNIDRRHIFAANPVFFLPYGFEVSSAIRLRSGRPIDVGTGGDSNEDRGGPDRPYSAAGVPFKRNAFRNRALYEVDFRAQKSFNFDESKKLTFSFEFFNMFNIFNIELAGSAVTNYCSSSTDRTCGFSAPTNPNFLQVRESTPGSARLGQVLTNNSPLQPFQMQFGARFQF